MIYKLENYNISIEESTYSGEIKSLKSKEKYTMSKMDLFIHLIVYFSFFIISPFQFFYFILLMFSISYVLTSRSNYVFTNKLGEHFSILSQD